MHVRDRSSRRSAGGVSFEMILLCAVVALGVVAGLSTLSGAQEGALQRVACRLLGYAEGPSGACGGAGNSGDKHTSARRPGDRASLAVSSDTGGGPAERVRNGTTGVDPRRGTTGQVINRDMDVLGAGSAPATGDGTFLGVPLATGRANDDDVLVAQKGRVRKRIKITDDEPQTQVTPPTTPNINLQERIGLSPGDTISLGGTLLTIPTGVINVRYGKSLAGKILGTAIPTTDGEATFYRFEGKLQLLEINGQRWVQTAPGSNEYRNAAEVSAETNTQVQAEWNSRVLAETKRLLDLADRASEVSVIDAERNVISDVLSKRLIKTKTDDPKRTAVDTVRRELNLLDPVTDLENYKSSLRYKRWKTGVVGRAE